MSITITKNTYGTHRDAKATGVTTAGVIFDKETLGWNLASFPVHAIELATAGLTMDVFVRLPSGAWGLWVSPEGNDAVADDIAPAVPVIIDRGRWTGIKVVPSNTAEIWIRSSI